MRNGSVTIVYNEPCTGSGSNKIEQKAILGVMEEVDAVHEALQESGYTVYRMPISPPIEDLWQKLKPLKTDKVFNLFEGWEGYPESEAVVASMLSAFGVSYTGSEGSVLAIALDKSLVKKRLTSMGIPTPDYRIVSSENISEFDLEFPCIVKPRMADASHGITKDSVVYDLTSLQNQIAKLCQRFEEPMLVEELIDGAEFNATVMGNEHATVLPVSEIVYTLPSGLPRILTYEAKWEADSVFFKNTFHVCPAEISDELRQQISDLALKTFKVMGCSGYARVDFRCDRWGRLYVLEINPNPDIAKDAGAARQARAAGMSYTEFIRRIALLAFGDKTHETSHQAHEKTRQKRSHRNSLKHTPIHC